ncbi:MAG: hypothetical protein FWE77_03200 [Clostridia bacterium]|nr:hypothetical protein [Clostridia bacterium]
MNRLIRAFLVVMVVLLALGIALLVQGAVRHGNRPLTPTTPGGSVHYAPAWSVSAHV